MWKLVLLSSLVVGVPTKQAPAKASANEKQEMAIPQLTRDVLAQLGTPVALTKAERKLLGQVIAAVKANPEMTKTPKAWGALVLQWSQRTKSYDPLALIQLVVHEAVVEQQQDAKYWANRLAYQNKLAGQLSGYIKDLKKKLRGFKGRPRTKVSARTLQVEHEFAEGAEPVVLGPVALRTPDEWQATLDAWEAELQRAGEDAQLANIDLRKALSKQQQTVQLLTNVSKTLHETAMAIIKKLG